jgi:AraC family transcriptional regulator
VKSQTRNRYVLRIDRAVALLEQAINGGEELPDPARLAEAAHLSPFHFHRVYRALTGETPGNTALRLRLLRALRLLADPEQPVTDAALAVGYETPQAFARAFRQTFGDTPSALRADPTRLAAAIEQCRHAPAEQRVPAPPLQVEVTSVEPFRVIALRNRGDYADLDQAFVRLFGWAAEKGLVERIAGVYGVPYSDHRDTPPDDFVFDSALAFDAPAEPGQELFALELGGGRWARLRHVGNYDGMDALTERLLAEWLPDSGHELRDAPLFHHYLDDPEQTPESMLRSDVYLPLV